MDTRSFLSKLEDKWDETRLRVKDKLGFVDTVIIYPYRGYAKPTQAVIKGRVLEKEKRIHEKEVHEGDLWHNLKKAVDRYESDEIPGVPLSGEFLGAKGECTTDSEGYFEMEFNWDKPLQQPTGWYPAKLKVEKMPFDLDYEEHAEAEILLVNGEHSFGVISDVDDTIIRSNITHPLEKVTTMLRYNARERTAFEGVSDLYRELVGQNHNPIFFVSGSSYNLYDLLVNFCNYHDIPRAPFMLRDLGLTADKWLKKSTMDYKLEHIDEIMPFFPELKFILIGDSGQKDPEIYHQVYKKYPGRIKAIYIRHVAADKRAEEIEKLNREMDVDMILMEETSAAMEHARQNGWIK